VRVRQASLDDLELVCRMRVRFLAEHRALEPDDLDDAFVHQTRSFLRHQHDAGRLHSWLAEDGECVGVTSMLAIDVSPRPEERRTLEGHILNVYVVPHGRRRGVGRALVDAAVAAAPRLGMRRLSLHTTDEGRPMYTDMGFAPNADRLELRLRPRP
jgi:GNAT superfamily N-acetyltransferase